MGGFSSGALWSVTTACGLVVFAGMSLVISFTAVLATGYAGIDLVHLLLVVGATGSG